MNAKLITLPDTSRRQACRFRRTCLLSDGHQRGGRRGEVHIVHDIGGEDHAVAFTALSLPELTSMDLRDAARIYAEAGVPVFPCVPGAKRPLTTHGLNDATSDLKQIAAWWERWPNANVAMATGGHGFDVIDVDVRSSGSGFAALTQARRTGLADGWAHLVRTPSTGIHLYYPADPTRPQRSWHLGAFHIDFCGSGGYVIAPPSRITAGNGRERWYTVVASSGKARPVDAAAVRALLAPPRPSIARPGRVWSNHVTRQRVEALRRFVGALQEGNRHLGLFWAACRLAEADVNEKVAHDALAPAAHNAGLPTHEAHRAIRNAYHVAKPIRQGSRPVSPDEAVTL